MTVSTSESKYKYIGTRPVRQDGLDKVTGRARFAADLNLPGMQHGIVVRSPHAHAKIVSIDTSKAEAMPGVKAVITAADFPALDPKNPLANISANLMARDKVLYEGHVVAAVAAETRSQARKAAAAVEVQYETLPHVLTVDEAMADGAVVLNEGVITRNAEPPATEPSNVSARTAAERGDLDAGFADADVVIEHEFTTVPVHQGYIEPHAAVADTKQDQTTNIWCSSQGHFRVQSQTAGMLGWEVSQVKVEPAEIGGGFGGKTTIYVEPLAAKLSEKSGRPVKIVMSRDEVFRATGPTSGTKIRVKIGAKNDGTLTAAEAWLAYESGAFPGIWAMLGSWCVFACYDVPNQKVEAFDVLVNKPVCIAYRAPSAPMAAFATETVLDEIAREIGMDPLELRLKNCAKEGDMGPMGAPHPRIGLKETLEAIRDSDHYQSDRPEGIGRGVAAGFWFNIGEQSSAQVTLNANGTAVVATGSPDIGGSRASMSLMAAETLGIEPGRIQPVVGDTDSVGFTDTTEGSRTTFASGMAVTEACKNLIEKLRARAAKMWECEVDEVEWADGEARHTKGENDALPLAAITGAAAKTGGPIAATASVNARGAGAGFSAQVCDLSVDQETGMTTIKRWTTAQDAGTAIHPSYVEGQMQGGVVQGIGWALNEEYIHNADGVMENPGFLDYRVPVASDLPMIDTIVVEVPNPFHPYGVRGVGEVGIVPPIACIANAVNDVAGVRIRNLPISPVRILSALTNGNGNS
ncbi:MAG: xanthine dehydrogenase family protein molybdopterin-binding subunit [Acidobacteriota bacterium]|nr:xanthine dehydrogenase family protein molybdopterin-binding subunit [Acidobacteriota bacterium]